MKLALKLLEQQEHQVKVTLVEQVEVDQELIMVVAVVVVVLVLLVLLVY